jgi:serine/threonine-protein kinase
MELVEGPTLADRIAQGPIPVDEALPIARQIAEALEAAHEQGIIHRDLKPANIKVRDDGTVKVLDFGLAKAVEPVGTKSSSASMSPTITTPAMMTGVGMILGTAAYMSPEQARGRPADKRSDVWAFGCVLYEMLTGKRAFDGEDLTETLAAIVRGEVDWRALPSGVPAQIRTLIERCLVKDRAQRLADLSVVRFLLTEAAALGTAPVAVTPRAARSIGLTLAAGLVAVAVLVTAGVTRVLSRPAARTDDAQVRLSLTLPEGDEVTALNELPLAVSPDGTLVAYVALRDGIQRLYLRGLADSDARAIGGTEGAKSPFFSPDGRWIGFFNTVSGKLQKVSVGGTAPEVVADAGDARGGCWGSDNMLYFAPTNTSVIQRVPASGGPATAVTRFEPGDISHRWPQLLPDGKTLIFTAWTGPGPDEHRIVQQSLASGDRRVLVRSADTGRYVATGHLVYGHLDGVFAAPWRLGQRDLGGAVPVALPQNARLDNEGASDFAVSDNGVLAFIRGGPGRRATRPVWVDRLGKAEPLPLPAREYESVVIAPDGRQAVVQIQDGILGLWLYDFARQTLTPFTTHGGSSQAPVWAPDGRSVLYRGTRDGFRNIFRKAADGTGSEERLTSKADVTQSPASVSPDGRWLVFTEAGKGGTTVWRLRLDGERTLERFLETPGRQVDGQVSPDGKWIAYTSSESGRNEIWVQPFQGPGSRRQVSQDGGDEARWSRDGRELFFATRDKLWAVDVEPGSVFGSSAPRTVFEGRYRPQTNLNTAYDVALDGKRFLRVQQIEPEKAATRIEIVLNWFPELTRIASGK